jgi:signal transduction histidine kinase
MAQLLRDSEPLSGRFCLESIIDDRALRGGSELGRLYGGFLENERDALRLVLVDGDGSEEKHLDAVLNRAGYDVVWCRAKTEEELAYALKHVPDIVLAYADHAAIDALATLTRLRELDRDVPVIVLAEPADVAAAIECVRKGAFDYVLLDELTRLGVTVFRALRRMRLASEKLTLEAQLQQAQRTEALGLLAGGVAHDFNNILTVITGQCQLLLTYGSRESADRGRLEIIERAADRGASLTRQLLAFSRREMLEPTVLDLNEVLKEMNGMLGRILGEDIVIEMDLPGDLGRVRADRGQVDQVIMNLAVNARDAMPRGGKLSLRTANVEVDEAWTRQRDVVRPGSYVVLSVSDRGEGMDREVMERIFEPFFTTKEPGRGTGLGLATVYGIVSQNGGSIYVSSKPGEGSTFYVLFPRVYERVNVAAEESLVASSDRGTILLVEDDDEVRKLLREILEFCGYTVLESAGGREALGRIERENGKVDLVVTDLVMPGMGGDEFADLLSVRFPKIKVLYTSGHTERPVSVPLVRMYRELIQKPFKCQELARRVRELVESNGDSDDEGLDLESAT